MGYSLKIPLTICNPKGLNQCYLSASEKIEARNCHKDFTGKFSTYFKTGNV